MVIFRANDTGIGGIDTIIPIQVQFDDTGYWGFERKVHKGQGFSFLCNHPGLSIFDLR
jgi:hypothetical protein